MIIVFANQKGGVGKTTNCIQFANYLAEKDIGSLVLDLDFQQSIADRRKDDLNIYENTPKYEVIETSIENISAMIDDFDNVDDGHLIIDMPGKIDEDKMISILRKADIIICPFRYDKLTMDSTALFINIVEYLNVSAKLFFLPNNINRTVKYEQRNAIREILKTKGFVTEDIPTRVAMERLNTLTISDETIDIVKGAYDLIITKGEIK